MYWHEVAKLGKINILKKSIQIVASVTIEPGQLYNLDTLNFEMSSNFMVIAHQFVYVHPSNYIEK